MNIAVIIGEVGFISRSKVIDGLVDAAKKDGGTVVLFTCEGFLFHNLKEYSKGEYNIFTLPAFEQYDGVVVELNSVQNPKIKEYLYDNIKNTNVPCVAIDSEFDLAKEKIYFDNQNGFRKLIEHLIKDHGVSDFYYLSGPFHSRGGSQRLQVFRDTLEAHSVPLPEENIYEGDFGFNSGIKAARMYLKSKKSLPQAFVAANDYMAIGIMEELKSNGIRIPEDVIVTGYDNCDFADLTLPRLTTVDRGEYRAGQLAYKLLLKDFYADFTRKRRDDVEIIEGEPVLAGSCGCAMSDDIYRKANQSAVNLKMDMDNSLDLLKGLTVALSESDNLSDYEHGLERYIEQMGMDYFYFCQCGSRESYYEELEMLAGGRRVKRNMTVYQDNVWCPLAYENGEWNTYPSYSRRLLFPPNANYKKEGGYYIVMPVHQGDICIGYSIVGNVHGHLSGRVIQHLILGMGAALGNIRKNDIMTSMLARINSKWQYDELTGLYNRSGLIYNAENLIESVAGEKTRGVSVIFFDLDGLKAINDTKGHEAGDEYIKLMADTLKMSADESDIVCRYGGDEYIVISIQESWAASLEKLEKIQEWIKPPVSASAGCVFGNAESMEELNLLIEEADRKMYEYKKKKKRARE